MTEFKTLAGPEAAALLKTLGIDAGDYGVVKVASVKANKVSVPEFKLPEPNFIDRLLMKFGIVRASKMYALVEDHYSLLQTTKQLARKASEYAVLADRADKLDEFLEIVGIEEIKAEHVGHDDDGNCKVSYELGVDFAKGTPAFASFGIRFEPLVKPEGTKDFNPGEGYGTTGDGTDKR